MVLVGVRMGLEGAISSATDRTDGDGLCFLMVRMGLSGASLWYK
jgi:hypothetical protein